MDFLLSLFQLIGPYILTIGGKQGLQNSPYLNFFYMQLNQTPQAQYFLYKCGYGCIMDRKKTNDQVF